MKTRLRKENRPDIEIVLSWDEAISFRNYLGSTHMKTELQSLDESCNSTKAELYKQLTIILYPNYIL